MSSVMYIHPQPLIPLAPQPETSLFSKVDDGVMFHRFSSLDCGHQEPTHIAIDAWVRAWFDPIYFYFSDVDLIDLCTTDEDCENGYDEDYDGLVDCEDPSCASDSVCTGFSGETDCSDGVDDEGDGLTDCGDPECFEETQCLISSGKVTSSTQVCSLFDGCLATSYELEGATNCMDFVYGYDGGDETYGPWMECILDVMVEQVGTCSAEEFGGCDCVAVEACDVAYETPPVESTEKDEVIDCTLPQYASTSDCITTTIDCTDSNEWCDPSCLTECNDPVLPTDPQNCSLCEDVEEDTSAPTFEVVDCTNASDPTDENHCHTECLVAEGYDCEDDRIRSVEECFTVADTIPKMVLSTVMMRATKTVLDVKPHTKRRVWHIATTSPRTRIGLLF